MPSPAVTTAADDTQATVRPPSAPPAPSLLRGLLGAAGAAIKGAEEARAAEEAAMAAAEATAAEDLGRVAAAARAARDAKAVQEAAKVAAEAKRRAEEEAELHPGVWEMTLHSKVLFEKVTVHFRWAAAARVIQHTATHAWSIKRA